MTRKTKRDLNITAIFIAAVAVTGFGGLVAQVLLLRELLIAFYGNELSIGVILANWLLFEAMGSFFAGKFLSKISDKLGAFVASNLAFSLFLPVAVFTARTLRIILMARPGEGLGLSAIFLGSLATLLFVGFLHGASFTLACNAYSSHFVPSVSGRYKRATSHFAGALSIGRVYVYEALGTIIGGIVFTYVFIPNLSSFWISFWILLLNIIISPMVLYSVKDAPAPRKFLAAALSMIAIAAIYFACSGALDKLNELSIRKQWSGENILHYQNSIYGNIAVSKSEEQYTFFVNRLPAITTPTPDIVLAEEFAHFSLLMCDNPKNVLLIGKGAGGLINEILKHPSIKIDYLELDPLLIRMLQKFPTPLTRAELSDRRVNLIFSDGRFFLRKTQARYDAILIGFSNPSDLQVNRFFTSEFYELVKLKLSDEGVAAIMLPGSLSYMPRELRDLNKCILNTLMGVFDNVRVIPGDYNIFICSSSPAIMKKTPAALFNKVKSSGIEVALLTEGYLGYRLDNRWVDWFYDSLKVGTVKSNRDFLPSGVFFSTSYWSSIFSKYMQGTFRFLERVNLNAVLAVLATFTALFLALAKRRSFNVAKTVIPLCVVTTGLGGMIIELVLIFAFQIIYGYVYNQVGLLITTFMAGTVAGSFIITNTLRRIRRERRGLLHLELLMAAFFITAPFLLGELKNLVDNKTITDALAQIIFLALSFIGGFLVGAEFPLANKIYLRRQKDVGEAVGLLYGLDLLGGWAGGILGGCVLLPVLGLGGTCVAVFAVKIGSSILLLYVTGKHRIVKTSGF